MNTPQVDGVDEVEEEIFYRSSQFNLLLAQQYYEKYLDKTPCMVSSQTGNKWLMEVLKGNEKRCYNMFRMDKEVFLRLCDDLEAKYGLLGSRRTTHKEVVGMCLHMLGHGVGNRLAQERFQHSGETISRYFGEALDILNLLGKEIIKPLDPAFNGVAPEILRDKRYMPHFKDCIGAIDGVHIQASITPQNQVPYIGRKGIPTQNVMAACNFDMQFIFACAGWEGSAHDTRVFLSVLRNPDMEFPKPPHGKYYLVDSGYPQMYGFLGPYKGQRQHFQQYRRREPTNEREVFNQAHSSLRSIIERTFGVWKKKWKILKDMPNYSYEKQVKIVIATMTLHNYIRRHANRDRHFINVRESSDNMSSGGIEMDADVGEEYHITHGPGAQEMETIRNNITQSLMSARSNVNV